MQNASLALEVDASLTRKAFDAVQVQAVALLASIPTPQEFSGRGAMLDVYA